MAVNDGHDEDSVWGVRGGPDPDTGVGGVEDGEIGGGPIGDGIVGGKPAGWGADMHGFRSGACGMRLARMGRPSGPGVRGNQSGGGLSRWDELDGSEL